MNIQLISIDKSFGSVHANDQITMVIPSGTIQGVLGENGAGKTTLMKILSGFYQQDSGRILLDGKEVKIHSPSDALQYGIGMLNQDPLDFPPLRVLDNFILGQKGGINLKAKKARKSLEALQKKFGFHFDPDNYVENLTVGERQQLEILRLLYLGAQVLILDEPTTGISAEQKEKIFNTLFKLVKENKTVIFVSHKLEEVEELCSQVIVLRQGKVVGEAKPPYKTKNFVRMMFGKEIKLAERNSCKDQAIRIVLKDLCLEDSRLQIKSINLQVSKGEIIGLAGMEGSGQQLFLRSLAGLVVPVSGEISIDGKLMNRKSYHNFQQAGVYYVPAARLEEGLISGFSLTEHVVLVEDQEGFFIKKEVHRLAAQNKIKNFNIQGNPESQVEQLSGGNQQRVSLALLRTPQSILLLEHPMRGLDMESVIDIWEKLREYCRQGTSLFFTSSDLEEIMRYSDRILVFFGGKVSKALDAEKTSVEQLGQMIGGKGFEIGA
jgi:general nucleoside transport system ATP-binding protein